MHTYLISYDLHQPHRDYTTLHKHLESYPNWAKPLESVWLIKSSLPIADLRNKVQTYMDKDDRLLVIDVTSDAAAWSTNLPSNVAKWILDNL